MFFVSPWILLLIISVVAECKYVKGNYYYKLNDIEHELLAEKTDGSQGPYYYVSDVPVTWAEAFGACNSIKGELVSPLNPLQDNDLRSFLGGENVHERIWMGGRVSGADENNRRVWFWETVNLKFYWTNFQAKINNCGSIEQGYCLSASTEISTEEWGWCRTTCSTLLNFVCEFTPPATVDPIPCGTTISTTEISATSELTTTLLVPTNGPPVFVCPAEDGLHPDPLDCGMFYTCQYGQPIAHQPCPAGLHWNDHYKYCDYPSNTQCYTQ